MNLVTDWHTMTVEEVTNRLIDYRGKTPPKTDSGVRLITAKVVKGGRILDDKPEFIAADFYDQWMRRGIPQQWDVLITTEAPLGEVALLRDPERIALAQRIILLRGNPQIIDQKYLFYALQSEFTQAELKGRATGTTVSGIKQSELRQVRLQLPDLPTQRRIAGILSAYDDLIENNLRRIRILEEMAQSLYREWFVHFRIPPEVLTKAGLLPEIKLVDSPLGKIPEGWEVKPVGECFEITGGGTPSKKVEEYWEGGTIQWYSPRDLTVEGTMFMEQSVHQITKHGLKKSSARIFPANSVMLTSRATIGAIAINTVPACTNQGFITCLPNERVPLYFLFQWLNASVDTFISHASGATFKEISKGVFRTLNFLLPPPDLVARYETAVAPVSEQLLNLQRRNQTLRQTRDLLLPKLLSGREKGSTP